VTPLHAAHFDHLISGDSLGCFKNLDQVLLIREICTSTQIIHGDLLFRHTHTLLQLRDMEHIVYI
jgi:hypothetical protein